MRPSLLGSASQLFLSCTVVLMFAVYPAIGQVASVGDAIHAIAPGLTVRVLRQGGDYNSDPSYCAVDPPRIECGLRYNRGRNFGADLPIGVDSAGNAYHVREWNLQTAVDNLPASGTQLLRVRPDGTTEVVAFVLISRCFDSTCSTLHEDFGYTPVPFLDVTNGRIIIAVDAELWSPVGSGTWVDGKIGLVALDGLPKMFDTLLTFVPGGQLSALLPGLPDGFRSADSMQVWTGDVRSMPDWSQAQSLTCSAATSPTPGQIVTVADTLPDPPVGHGRYYLVASQSGPDRRLGRQYVNGAFSARDTSKLPVCIPLAAWMSDRSLSEEDAGSCQHRVGLQGGR